MVELDFDDSVARGLRGYVRLVTRSVGLRGECSYVQTDEVAHAYVAIDGALPLFPGQDVALLWDEKSGWAAAVEHRNGSEPQVVARLGGDVLPSPEAVAEWARGLFHQHRAGPGTPRPTQRGGDLQERLASYASVLH